MPRHIGLSTQLARHLRHYTTRVRRSALPIFCCTSLCLQFPPPTPLSYAIWHPARQRRPQPAVRA